MAGKITELPLLEAVDGDADFIEVMDADEATVADKNKRVPAKHVTGGMVAHGNAVKALSKLFDSNSTVAKWYQIAVITAVSNSDHTYIKVSLTSNTSGAKSQMLIHISGLGTGEYRVESISGGGNHLSDVGVVIYDDGTDINIYAYFSGTGYNAIAGEILSTGSSAIATVIPPNKISYVTSVPAGTLKLDTTAGKYADGVPDGNEDWNALTVGSGWVGTLYYMREADGTVHINGDNLTVGTTTYGTVIGTMPAGYIIERDKIIDAPVVVGSVWMSGGLVSFLSNGQIATRNIDAAATTMRIETSYKAVS